MSKKDKKIIATGVESLAADFDQALFDELVRLQENSLRDKCADGIKPRLYNLERLYGSRDTAFRIWAEEKVMLKIRRKQNPDEDERTAKNSVQRTVVYSNGHRLRRREAANSDEAPRPLRSAASGSWRNWGQG